MKVALAAALLVAGSPALAQGYYGSRSSSGSYGTGSNPSSHYVQPHVRSDGGMGGGYYRTNPNNTTLDNYGTRGNLNPYSGQTGRGGGSLY